MLSFHPPDQFDEYRLLRLLGSGAMGSVYLARDTLLDRLVAIKFLAALAPTPTARDRFLVEARAVARLTHPNVVAIHRVGMMGDRPYLVSEYIRGEGLDHVARPMRRDLLVAVALGVARGLAAVHRHGIVHRDVKPANVLLSDGGEVKLVDFGLAKLLDAPPPEPPSAPRASTTSVRRGPDDEVVVSPTMLPDSADALAATVGLGALETTVSQSPGAAVASRTPASGDSPRGADPNLTAAGTLLGTPRYMAPEVWAGEPGSARADVYSAGALIYELAAGVPPHAGVTFIELGQQVQSRRPRPLADVAKEVDARLAVIVDRCLERDPLARFASGDELRRAIEEMLARPAATALPAGNPYRGLHAFDEAHAAVFFGRGSEVRDVVELLRRAPVVTVTGSSGVGKSSLCRAGVLPGVTAGALGAGRAFLSATLSPGKAPVESFARVVARALGLDAAALAEELRTLPGDASRSIGRALGQDAGLVVLVDQLEELVTIAPPEEARAFGAIVLRLAEDLEAMRFVLVTREDFLGRVVDRTGLGGEITRAVQILGPLRASGLREAIEAPAQAMGHRFDSDATVEELAAWVERADGGLPLLQFALAELWESRDVEARTLTMAALTAMGGVSGALTRHADGVVAALLPEERETARRLLGQLVTPDGTRAQRTARELGAERGTAAEAALDALVRGRLVVARASADGHETVLEIAHEALLRGWETLRGWLARDAEARAVRERLTRASAEWARLGEPREGLWTARQLAEARLLGAVTLGAREASFLSRSRSAVRRRRASVAAAGLALPSVVLGVIFAARLAQRRDLDAQIAARTRDASAALAEARSKVTELDRARTEAFARFDAQDGARGEDAWDEAKRLGGEAQDAFARSLRAFDAALSLDEHRSSTRAAAADAVLEAARLADSARLFERRDALLERLAQVDDGGVRLALLSAPAALSLTTHPAGATIRIERYGAMDGRPADAPRLLGVAPLPGVPVAPGSYRLVIEREGEAPVLYPLVLAAGERCALDVPLPEPGRVPPGFVYVPAGRFLFGSAGDEDLRRFFYYTAPLHEVKTGPYLIARTETTFAEWIAFLRSLPAAERARRTPRASTAGLNGSLELREGAGGAYVLAMQPGERAYEAREGEPIRYAGRDRRATEDWLKFPVSGVSWDDAAAYAAWLDATGRVPGARLCTEYEWERAARGADGRLWPHGDRLEPDDANYDATYGKSPLAFGPDEVGSHLASRSPFGVDDLVANVWEWVDSSLVAGERVLRGGSYYFGRRTNLVVNREVFKPEMRDATLGVRVCATFPRR